ncbi:hypothetical protein KR026_002456 [Drosophila bipectinata]|nr:hypothetical protein KR026_002456 [Drosophila bipectinata]
MSEEEKNNFNADELAPPEWLDEHFIGQALRSYEKSPELQVTDLKFTPASAKGDHYASIMFRARARYTSRKGEFSKSLIIKTMPVEEGLKKDMFEGSPLFSTEIGMYTKVLPEVERTLRQVGDRTKLYAECIYHSLEPRQVIIFEDLVEMGYEVVRKRWLTEEEISNAYSKLAKIHAVSMKMINERPDYLKEFKYGMCEMPGLLDSPIINAGMAPFQEMLSKHDDLAKYKPYFEKINLEFKERLCETMQEYRKNPQPEAYYVLCHGDFHSRNMMFKHNKETGCYEDVMLLDYQGGNVVPIPVDLMYSIYMLMGPEQRAGELENLLKYYFSILLETLRKIDYRGKMPCPLGFWAAMKRHRYYEFLLISTFLPISVGLRSKGLDIGDLLHNAETRKFCYDLPEYVQDARNMLQRFERVGYFEDL